MSDERSPGRSSDYRIARIAAAMVLVLTLAVLFVFDALSTAYDLQPPTVGVLGTMILVLLGLEVPALVRRSGNDE
jgi:peptidoglycan/LPS O-acetylase OafA/YrhL